MSQLSVTLLRLGFLVLLWALVLSAIARACAPISTARASRRAVAGARHARRPTRVAEKTAAPSRAGTGVAAGAISTSEAPAAHLAVTAGPLKGTTLPLGSAPILVGRAPTCTLVIDDDYSPRGTAASIPENGEWCVEDLGSTNGTFLGNQQRARPRRLPSRRRGAHRRNHAGAHRLMFLGLHFAARSDVGLVRANNQDSGYAGPHLLLVADGMGGAAGGDIASSIVGGATRGARRRGPGPRRGARPAQGRHL